MSAAPDPFPVDALLRWRLARAQADAPPPPTAARLLQLARPWWEAWPDRWQRCVRHVGRVQLAYGHAMTTPGDRRESHPVAALLVGPDGEAEVLARVLYLSVRDGRLRLRFVLPAPAAPAEAALEVLFVAEREDVEDVGHPGPVLVARADRSVEREYHLDAPLPAEVARAWAALRVTDRMPFRLVLRPVSEGEAGPSGDL